MASARKPPLRKGAGPVLTRARRSAGLRACNRAARVSRRLGASCQTPTGRSQVADAAGLEEAGESDAVEAAAGSPRQAAVPSDSESEGSGTGGAQRGAGAGNLATISLLELKRLPNVELRKLCSEACLPTVGTKAVLVERLHEASQALTAEALFRSDPGASDTADASVPIEGEPKQSNVEVERAEDLSTALETTADVVSAEARLTAARETLQDLVDERISLMAALGKAQDADEEFADELERGPHEDSAPTSHAAVTPKIAESLPDATPDESWPALTAAGMDDKLDPVNLKDLTASAAVGAATAVIADSAKVAKAADAVPDSMPTAGVGEEEAVQRALASELGASEDTLQRLTEERAELLAALEQTKGSNAEKNENEEASDIRGGGAPLPTDTVVEMADLNPAPTISSASGVTTAPGAYTAEPEQKHAVGGAVLRAPAPKDSSPLTEEELCAVHAGQLYFFEPALTAGRASTLYFNRAVSDVLCTRPTIVVQFGFNHWQWENGEVTALPTSVPKYEGVDWWTASVEIPVEAYEMNMVFHDSDGAYENNCGMDFVATVEGGMSVEAFASIMREKRAAVEAARREAVAKEIAARQAIAGEEVARMAEDAASLEAEGKGRRAAEVLASDRRIAEEAISSERWQAEHASRELPVAAKGRYFSKPAKPAANSVVTVLYNAEDSPLDGAGKVFIVLGRNGWQGALKETLQMRPATKTDTRNKPVGQWWKVAVEIPEGVWQLDFVATTQEGQGDGYFDNNSMQDYHIRVEHNMSDTDWEARIAAKAKEVTAAREMAEAKETIRAEERKARRSVQRAKALEAVRRSQAHIWYSEPAEPRVGDTVKIYYNPSNTLLKGCETVYMRGSWNRWKHSALWGPVTMEPADTDGGHMIGEMLVPADAWCMDFVFSDSPAEHANYDNKNGLDYHLPIAASGEKEPPMHIMHVAVEMAPIAKVGGLGDVVTSISRAIRELGHQVEVVLPKYDCINYAAVQDLREDGGFQFGSTYWRVFRGEVVGVPTFFLAPDRGDFNVGCIYGRADDEPRFGFFCHAALEFMLTTDRSPDIVHCHDWSSAPVARMLSEFYGETHLGKTQSVFTIHNLNYGAALIGEAMHYSAMATTVSPTYAWEVGDNPAVAPSVGKFHGIRNGIDPDIWDPETDIWLPRHYSADDIVEGKAANKRALQQRLGMAQDPDRPLVGIVTRLTAQKGIHLIQHTVHRVLERGGQVVLLGSAPDPKVQAGFEAMRNDVEQTSHGRMVLSYDEPLSHLIYAGADMICVPSMFEPCGLTQLIAMRFGSVPVVRKTGGLNDTVFDIDHDKERCGWYGYDTNGFSFEGTDSEALDYALNRAIDAYYDARDWFRSLQLRCLEQDFTWNRPALEYMEVRMLVRKETGWHVRWDVLEIPMGSMGSSESIAFLVSRIDCISLIAI